MEVLLGAVYAFTAAIAAFGCAHKRTLPGARGLDLRGNNEGSVRRGMGNSFHRAAACYEYWMLECSKHHNWSV